VGDGGLADSGPALGPEPLLRVRGLEARYGPIAAVRGIDLDVRSGEIVALLGANGAGKTSTLAAIVGLLASRRGAVRFDGEDISRLPPEKIVRRGIALTPEGRRLFATLTVAENLALAARQRDWVGRERLLGRFPILRDRLDQPAGSLSGGEQQQLAIARSLMSRPRLLLLDEPTLGLAPKLIASVFELIAGLRDDEGVTVLLVEQDVHRALDLCDRAYVMRTGRIEAEGTSAELRRAGLETAYLGVA
jgi:branched-chain amino acid transport system ATP-binding protein